MRQPALLVSLFVFTSFVVAQPKPNIVLIMTDDAGYGDFGFTGSLQIQTKNIDWLARYGCVFETAYVSGPVCSPSRAGLLTGRYQNRFGHEDNLAIGEVQPGDTREDIGLPTEEKTIADYLSKEGYICGVVGKWHLGEEEKFHPKNRGFDYWYFFRGGSRPYFERNVGKGQEIETNMKGAQPVSYLTDDLGREAARFIKDNKDGRYFLYLSFNAPHTPLQAKPEDLVGLEHIRSTPRRNFVGMMKSVDRAVGNVLRAIEESGKEKDTMVVFLNDNGGQIDAGAVNAPYRGMKGTFLEGGVRVPLVVRYPRLIPLPVRRKKPVVAIDLLPTILAAAEIEPIQSKLHTLDGVDLWLYATGQTEAAPHEDLFWRMGLTAAVRSGDWKLIRMPNKLPMLFNLANDPYEANNLILDYPTKATELFKKLFDWEAQMIYPRWHTDPLWYVDNAKRYERVWRLTQPDD